MVCMCVYVVTFGSVGPTQPGGDNSTVPKLHQKDFQAISENFENSVKLAQLNCKGGG